jgi:hypothetical protein
MSSWSTTKNIHIFRVYHIRIIAKKNWFTRHETDVLLNNHCQECVRAYLSIHDYLSFLHEVMIGNHWTKLFFTRFSPRILCRPTAFFLTRAVLVFFAKKKPSDGRGISDYTRLWSAIIGTKQPKVNQFPQ